MYNNSVGSSSSSCSMSNKKLLQGGAECWVTAEKTAQKILSVLQPNIASDQKRLEIVNYIRELIIDIVGDEVRPLLSLIFGSFDGLRAFLISFSFSAIFGLFN